MTSTQINYSVDGHHGRPSIWMRREHGLYHAVVVVDLPSGVRHAHYAKGCVRERDAHDYAERYLSEFHHGAAVARVPKQ